MECAYHSAYFMPEADYKAKSKPNGNIIEINLNCLRNSTSIATGSPLFCTSCGSLFNSSSILIGSDSSPIWNCEFCLHQNEVTIEEEEIPKHLELTYLLEVPETGIKQEPMTITPSSDTSAVIFCIDYSGSMGASKRIPGRLQLRTRGNQKPDSDFTDVTRLECMQAAVESQLQNILATSPMKKVGLVCFESSVDVVGDGINHEFVNRAAINNFGEMMSYGQSKRGVFLNSPIIDSINRLSEKLMSLRPCGGTALGPGLLISILIASEGGQGPKSSSARMG